MELWQAVFSDTMEIDGESSFQSSQTFGNRKVTSLSDQMNGLTAHPVLSFVIYRLNTSHATGKLQNPPSKRPTQSYRFQLTCQSDELMVQDYIQGFRSVSPSDLHVSVEWNGSSACSNDDHFIFQVLDVVNELHLLGELGVSGLQSPKASQRIAKYIQTNPRFTCLRLGLHLGNWQGLEKSAETIGNALALNTSISRFQFLPFSTNTSVEMHGEPVERAIESILQGVRYNRNIQSLHLWAPGMIPPSMVRETVIGHPSIVELFLDGETAPWYRGKGVDQYHEFQHLVWGMLSSPGCNLQKLKLHNFHLNTTTVDIFLASLWKAHPLQVLDVSGNFLTSLHFPRYIESNAEEKIWSAICVF